MAARSFLGSGDLYIARYNATTGDFDEYAGPYECNKFELAPKSEIKNATSKSKSNYGNVIETVALNQPAEFGISLPEVNTESLLLALLGTDAAVSQSGGTLSNDPIVAVHDKWVAASKHNLASAGLVLTNSAGTVTYVLGTDYEVNLRMGWIKALSTGAIANGATLHLDATYGAVAGRKISGGTAPQLRARFLLDGQNMADNSPCIVTVFEAVVAANSAFDFMGDDFASVELSGQMKTPVGMASPYTVELHDVA